MRKKILVCDDTPEIVQYIETTLRKASYDTVSATDGEAALEKAKSERFDLVLLDVTIPPWEHEPGVEPTGCQVARDLLADPATKEIPVIMMPVGSPSPEDYPPCKDLPDRSVAYLYKPFSEAELLSYVEDPPFGDPLQHDLTTKGLQHQRRIEWERRHPSDSRSSLLEARPPQKPWWLWWRR